MNEICRAALVFGAKVNLGWLNGDPTNLGSSRPPLVTTLRSMEAAIRVCLSVSLSVNRFGFLLSQFVLFPRNKNQRYTLTDNRLLTMASAVEGEVWIISGAIFMMLVGFTALVAKKASGLNLNLFHYLKLGGVVGVLLLPIAFLYAAVTGRLAEFAETVFTAPLQLFSSIGTGQSYAESCTNGKCASYCCQDPNNTNIKWKDCDPDCNSVIGVRGVNTGDDCLYDANRSAHCASTSTGGVLRNDAGSASCNYLPQYGPITCTCCTAPDGEFKFYDCAPNCSSNPKAVGFPLSIEACQQANTQHVYCEQSISQPGGVDQDVQESNSQNK